MKIGKNPCPKCRENGHDDKGDNFYFYGEGLGGYCFACGYTILSDSEKEARGIDAFNWFETMEDEVSSREKLTREELDKIKGYTGTDGHNTRGITNATYKAYAVRFKYDEETGEVTHHYYPYTEDKEASGYKVRKLPKDFSVIGRISSGTDLFGQWKWKNASGKFAVLCAGEIDALSAFQMLDEKRVAGGSTFDPIPVVSAAVGENGSHKQIAKHYDWFDRFQHVIVIYDQDETGKEAVKELVKVLPKGKMCVVDLPAKDINKMLEDGRQQEFINAFWKYHSYTPDGIVSSGGLMDKIIEQALTPKIPLPPFMHRLQDMMAGGIPLGVIVNLASASGTGKSTLVEEMNYFWFFDSPYMIGVVSLEADVGQYGTKILSRHISQKIDLIEDLDEKVGLLQCSDTQEKAQTLWYREDGTPRFYLIEERDGGIESMKALVMNLVVTCGCKVIVLDPMTDLIDSMTLEQQAAFMKWQKGLVKSHNITFINISHTRKSGSGQKAGSTGGDLHEEDMFGNSAIYKSAACNIIFSRNKEAEDEFERNTIKMKATKIRWTGRTGFAGEYFYDAPTHTLWDKEEYLMKHAPRNF